MFLLFYIIFSTNIYSKYKNFNLHEINPNFSGSILREILPEKFEKMETDFWSDMITEYSNCITVFNITK